MQKSRLAFVGLFGVALVVGCTSVRRTAEVPAPLYDCVGLQMTEAQIADKHGLSQEAMRLLAVKKNIGPADVCTTPPGVLATTVGKLLNPARASYPRKYMEWRANTLRDENGVVAPDGLMKAQQFVNKRRAATGPDVPGQAGIENNFWTWLGPGNVGGRIRGLVIHPTDTDTMWAGSVGGGLWKTTDAGANWSVVDDFMGNLAVTSIVIDPNDSAVMYAATGEGFFNIDALRGAGVFKSVNGGVTWSQLSGTNNANFYYVNRIAISPDGDTLLAATNTGLYYSTDAGSGWTLSTNGCSQGRDIDFDPNDSNKAVAGCSNGTGKYSTDAGVTWTTATPTVGSGRWEVAYAPSNSSIVYASIDSSNGVLYRSTDGGQTYTLQNTGTSFLSGQGWYDNALWVDPTNAATVIAGGVDLYRSTDSGTTLSKITDWRFAPDSSAHADHHIVVAHPNFDGTSNTTVFFGNDGGVYRASNVYTVDDTTGWQELNNNLGVTQFYGAGATAAGKVIAGAQDNGTLVYSGDAEGWVATFGGDGGYSAADPDDANYLYGEYVFLNIHRSTNGGGANSSAYISGQFWNGSAWAWKSAPYRIDDAMNSTANFIAPFIIDPNASQTILGGGMQLWRTTDARTANTTTTGPQWASIKPSVSSEISAIAVAPGNSDLIYVGHNNGNVYKTTNGSAGTPTWTKVDDNATALPGRQVLRILIDSTDNNIVYVTFAGFNANNVWRTTNGGTGWSQRTGTASNILPSAPVRSIVHHPGNSSRLYAGTEVGIFTSEDAGLNWNVTHDGPANVSVDEVFFVDTTLYAVTHGRGVYSVNVPSTGQQRGVTFVASASTVLENGGSAAVPVVVTSSDGLTLGAQVTVNYTTTAITATAGSDYTTTTGTLTFNSGLASGSTLNVTVPLLNDGASETAETFKVTLSSPSGAILGIHTVSTVTINDDDSLPSLSINDVALAEGNSGSTNASFTVTLSGSSGSTVTAAYATANGTATTGSATQAYSNNSSISTNDNAAGTPYPSTITVPTLPSPVTKVTVTLTNFNHTWPSDADVLLVGPTGVKVLLMSDICDGTPATNQTLTFDDAATGGMPGCPVSTGTYQPTNRDDSGGGGGNDTFPATAPAAPYGSALSGFIGTAGNGTWSLYVRDDVAGDTGTISGGWTLNITTATGDYAGTSGIVSFAPGVTTQQIVVPVLGDTAEESNETFFVNLTSPTNATISDSQGLGTITNDDGSPDSIVWTNIVGATASGSDLTKTNALGWTAGATSTMALGSGDGYMELVASETNTARMIGLSWGGNNGQHYNEIEYAIYLVNTGNLVVYENGVSKGGVGPYTNGDVLRVGIESGVVKYRKNGALLYTSSQVPIYPLVVDAALYTASATVQDVTLVGTLTSVTNGVPVVWTDVTGATATGNDLAKTGTTGWNAGGYSTKQIASGDGYLEFTASETTTLRMIGLSNGSTGVGYTEIDYCVYLTSSGSIVVFENGVSRGSVGTYVNGSVIRVALESGAVKYRKNGTLLYSSAIAPTYPLLVDASLYTTGATLNDAVLLGTLSDAPQVTPVVWTSAVGVTVSGNDLTKTAATGWNAGAASTTALGSGDGYFEFTASEANTARMIGLGNGNTGTNYTEIDYAVYLSAGGAILVYENGVYRGNMGGYATGNVIRVAIEAGVVKYRKNGTLLYTSAVAPTYPLLVDSSLYTNGATLNDSVIFGNLVSVTPTAVVWTSVVGATATGNDLAKTAALGWNAGAVSNASIASGSGYMEFTASETNTARMIGLSVGNTGTNYTEIDFAFYLTSAGSLVIYENGVSKGGLGGFVTGDILRVAVESGVVKYRKNGVVVYTSLTAPTYPLLVDTSLYSLGATLNDVMLLN